jgi:hypothetical protein
MIVAVPISMSLLNFLATDAAGEHRVDFSAAGHR